MRVCVCVCVYVCVCVCVGVCGARVRDGIVTVWGDFRLRVCGLENVCVGVSAYTADM